MACARRRRKITVGSSGSVRRCACAVRRSPYTRLRPNLFKRHSAQQGQLIRNTNVAPGKRTTFALFTGRAGCGTWSTKPLRARGSIPLRSTKLIRAATRDERPNKPMRHNLGPPKTQSRFLVVLQGAAGGDDGAHLRTLRFLLKYLLRSRSLRCVELRQLDCDNDGSER